MKSTILVLLNFVFYQSIFCQVGNDKKMILKNNVKSSIERHCFLNSNGSCTTIELKYDKRGNIIYFDMGRLGSYQKMIYDERDNEIFNLWIDKSSPESFKDTIFSVYDKNNNLIKDWQKVYDNNYNNKNQLIKQFSESYNNDKNLVRKTRMINWTKFGKIESKKKKTEILEVSEKTDIQKLRVTLKKYIYDRHTNLKREIHYDDGVVENTIIYSYDSLNRLVEKKEKDIDRLKRVNRMKFGNRKNFTEFITRISYNKKGQIKEKYEYFMDPCMSLDNNFLYKHFYKKNGLLERLDVYELDKLTFVINYDYEYF